MSDNSSSTNIKLAARGPDFFNKIGQLKSKVELRANIEKATVDSPATSRPEAVANALPTLESRFRTEIGSVANDVNRRASQLKQSKQSLKTERQALHDLKQAFDNSDEEKASRIKENIRQVREHREQSNTQIEKEQRLSTEQRILHLGNKEQGRVSVPELKLPKVEKNIPNNAQDTKAQIKNIDKDLEGLETQKDGIAQARDALSETLNSGRSEIEELSADSLKSIDTAQQSANNISSEAKTLSRDELLSSVAAKISPASVSNALKA